MRRAVPFAVGRVSAARTALGLAKPPESAFELPGHWDEKSFCSPGASANGALFVVTSDEAVLAGPGMSAISSAW